MKDLSRGKLFLEYILWPFTSTSTLLYTDHLLYGSLNQMGTNSKIDKDEKEIKSSKDLEGGIAKKATCLKF